MDIALSIEKLIPAAKYSGVPKDESSYKSIKWEDERSQPTWDDISKAWSIVQNDLYKKECEAKLDELSKLYAKALMLQDTEQIKWISEEAQKYV